MVIEGLPLYECHKRVRAARIAKIHRENSGAMALELEGIPYPVLLLASETAQRPTPEVGWYYVQYDNGYSSFSPAKAFEEGYTLASLLIH